MVRYETLIRENRDTVATVRAKQRVEPTKAVRRNPAETQNGGSKGPKRTGK